MENTYEFCRVQSDGSVTRYIPGQGVKITKTMANTYEFWRVQSDESFTRYIPGKGFEANYLGERARSSISQRMFESHLRWSDCPPRNESTPFISVFANHYDAAAHAGMLVRLYHTGVFVAKIVLSEPTTANLEIDPVGSGLLPILVESYSGDDRDPAYFISSIHVREHLGVRIQDNQLSVWFAMDFIPHCLITEIETYQKLDQ